MAKSAFALGVLGFLVACGGAKTSAVSPPANDETVRDDAGASPSAAVDGGAEATATASPKGGLPTTCASPGSDLCVPDPAFVKRLCDGSFPDVALSFFRADAPWSRGWLTRNVDGWNAEGGSAARAKLAFDEEVVLLRRRTPPKNGIQVGGSGAGYLVLRDDGNCYTLDDIELTRKAPPKAKFGPVTFRYLEAATQNALMKNARIAAAADRRRKECKGVTSGEVSKACEAADAELARAVPEEVRKGIALPPPSRVP